MISREDILNLAQLARLKLGEAEAESLQKDISNILDYVGQVSATGAAAGESSPPHRTIMREDRPEPTLGEREVLVGAFPRQEGGYNVVRKIIQKDE